MFSIVLLNTDVLLIALSVTVSPVVKPLPTVQLRNILLLIVFVQLPISALDQPSTLVEPAMVMLEKSFPELMIVAVESELLPEIHSVTTPDVPELLNPVTILLLLIV